MASSLLTTVLTLGLVQGLLAIPLPPGIPRHVTCDSTFSELLGPGPFRVICPSRRTCLDHGEVVGCNRAYTKDSHICRAAIHTLGSTTLGDNTIITVDSIGKRTTFNGVEKNQVVSIKYTTRTPLPAYRFFVMKANCESQLMNMLPGNTGTLMFTCPRDANGNKCKTGAGKNGGKVWGSPKAYTDDSALCRSAIQAFGTVALAQGTIFTVQRKGVQSNFIAFARNGVESLSWTTEWRAYTFQNVPDISPISSSSSISSLSSEPDITVRGAMSAPTIHRVDCTTKVENEFKGMTGLVHFVCPIGNTCLEGGKIWGGPARYTDDSALCRSAIQKYGSALLEPKILSIEILGTFTEYYGTDKNGVDSLNYFSSWKAYRFVGMAP